MGSFNRLGMDSRQCEGTGAESLLGRPQSVAHERHNGHSIRTRTWTDRTCNKGTVKIIFQLNVFIFIYYKLRLKLTDAVPFWFISNWVARAKRTTALNDLGFKVGAGYRCHEQKQSRIRRRLFWILMSTSGHFLKGTSHSFQELCFSLHENETYNLFVFI